MHRQATPILVPTSEQDIAEPLRRLELKDGGQYDEHWVQQLVHSWPSVLPISSIEPAFWPVFSVCMELPLRSGALDNLLVTPSGDLIAVECKLWRNAEARRKVIAQIIDYAKDLQALNYPELEGAIRTARKEPAYDLFSHISQNAEHEAALDEARFIDAVSRNLRRGRFLLIIVGDGITENVEAMAEYLQQHVGLHFALALIQLAVHELPRSTQRIVVPSIPMRTSNVLRGIVEMADSGFRIVAPPEAPQHITPTTLTADEFFSSLDRVRSGTMDRLVEFLKHCEDLQIAWDVKRTLIVRMIVGEYKTTPLVISPNGTVDTSYTFGMKDLLKSYAQALASAIPGTIARETPKSWIVKKQDGRFFTVWDLLEHVSGVRGALEVLNRTLQKAADDA